MGELNRVPRDVAGRVLPGARLAAGNRGSNPTARRVNELRAMVVEATTEDEVRGAFKRLYELGMGGEVSALKLFLEYCCGKPVTSVEVSTTEGSTLSLDVIISTMLAVVGDNPTLRVAVADAFYHLSNNGSDDKLGNG